MKQVTLTPERRAALARLVQQKFHAEFDEELSEFRADALIGLMLETMGPAVYNQAVQDVRAHLQGKLDDLDGEVWVDESV